MKYLLIALTFLSSTLYPSQFNSPNNNQEYLYFLRQSCQQLFVALPPTTPVSNISPKQILAAYNIIQRTKYMLYHPLKFPLNHPTEQERHAHVELKWTIAKYEELLNLYAIQAYYQQANSAQF